MTSTTEQYSNIRLLIIDDDPKLCRLVKDYLTPMGYDIESAHTGPQGLEMARTGNYQAVILDCMLPGMDGFEVLRQLRRASQVPVLMLTALGDESDRIVGLELGADDYLPKTFSTRELLARLRAVTRRSSITSAYNAAATQVQQEGTIEVGSLKINPDTRTVTLDGKPVWLTAVEFDLLLALARAP